MKTRRIPLLVATPTVAFAAANAAGSPCPVPFDRVCGDRPGAGRDGAAFTSGSAVKRRFVGVINR